MARRLAGRGVARGGLDPGQRSEMGSKGGFGWQHYLNLHIFLVICRSER